MSEATTPDLDTDSGEIVIPQDQLHDPVVTLQRVEELIAQPDDKGQIPPSLRYIVYEPEVFDGGYETATRIVGDDGITRIGGFKVITSDEEQAEYFSEINAMPGKGIGRRAYLDAIKGALERGHDFRNDPDHLSDEAVEAWRRLANQGVAQIVEEFEELPTEGDTKYRGYYVVNGNGRPKKLPTRGEKITLEEV